MFLSSVARSAFFSANFKSSFNQPSHLQPTLVTLGHDLGDTGLPAFAAQLDDAFKLHSPHSAAATLFSPTPAPTLCSPPTGSTPHLTPLPHVPPAASSSATLVNAPPLSADDFLPVRLVGEGGFGRVYHVVDRMTGRPFALKVIPKERLRHRSQKLVMSEQRVLRTVVGDAAFLQLHASWHDAANFFFLTDFLPCGTLRGELKREKRFYPEIARHYAAELLLALEKLHRAGIVHRDVKPDNVLLDAAGHLVLADFGLARVLRGGVPSLEHAGAGERVPGVDEVTRSPCGTMRYMAPEALTAQPYSYGVDVWAVGVVLYLMLCGRVPFGHDVARKDYKQALLTGTLTFDDTEVDSVAQDLLTKLLQKDPAVRIGIAEVKKHPFFAPIDWDALVRRELLVPHIPSPKPPTTSRVPPTLRAAPFHTPDDDLYPEFTFITPSFRDGNPELFGKCAPSGDAYPRKMTRWAPHAELTSSSISWGAARRRVRTFFARLFRRTARRDALPAHASEPTLAGAGVCESWVSVQLSSAKHSVPAGAGKGEGAEGEHGVLERVWWFVSHSRQGGQGGALVGESALGWEGGRDVARL